MKSIHGLLDWKLSKKWFHKNLYSMHMVLMTGIDSDT